MSDGQYGYSEWCSCKLTFKVHGTPEANLVPSLKHTRLEIKAVDWLLRLRDDECPTLGMNGTCRTISTCDRRRIKTYSGRTTPNRWYRGNAGRRPPKRDHHRGRTCVLENQISSAPTLDVVDSPSRLNSSLNFKLHCLPSNPVLVYTSNGVSGSINSLG